MRLHQTAGFDLPGLFAQAHAAHVAGALAQAGKLYQAILKRDPGNFDVLHRLGIISHQRGRPAEALRYLAAALERNARSKQALADHGLVLHTLGRIEEALASYGAALAIDPDDADLLNRHGVALNNLGRPHDALASLERVLALDPAHAEALGNRGNVLVKLNRPGEAIASYDAARRVAGDSARLLTNRAHALRRLDRPEEALSDLRAAIALEANHAEAQFELGLAQLTLGNFADGWAAYEARWATAAFAAHRRDFRSPLWTGAQPVDGRTILLHGEQGLGDTIQFVRYATQVARMGATVVLEVQPELAALLAQTAGATRVIARGQKLVAFDLHCPLMSLPRACGTTSTAIPADVPYIDVPKDHAARWAQRLPAGIPRVGVAWAGRPTHHNDANRSIALTQFAPLFAVAGIQFVSLQRDARAEDRAFLRKFPNLIDAADDLRDFADTAALLSQLDYVVSVDTAVAHLAGALAKPISVLLPFAADFRWLRGRSDNPWYPTATLVRQPRFGEWESAVDQVGRYLAGPTPWKPSSPTR